MKVARFAWLLLAVLLAWVAACKRPPERSLPNIQTSFGTLAEVQRRMVPDPLNPAVSPKSGQVAYILTFKGNIVIPDYDYQNGWEKRAPLVDAHGQEFAPVLAGTPGKDGKLSQDNWTISGMLTGLNGRFVFKGSATATVADGILVLAYLVPANARGVTLKDGTTNHPLGMD